MNEVPGKIANVLPIYPVRYGYANFFDTIMPAQAPPTLPDMASASGPIETEKLAFITQGFYESLSSKQERKKILVEMVNSALLKGLRRPNGRGC
ncbi:hypothetical protein ABS858_23740 [Vibrio neptunius]|uniref:hypothetical protein n=1 Tax=Vibrio neptunius TaxID=170651 RepID=UPI003314C123